MNKKDAYSCFANVSGRAGQTLLRLLVVHVLGPPQIRIFTPQQLVPTGHCFGEATSRGPSPRLCLYGRATLAAT